MLFSSFSPDICGAQWLTFKSLLKEYLLSEPSPDHLCNLKSHPILLRGIIHSLTLIYFFFILCDLLHYAYFLFLPLQCKLYKKGFYLVCSLLHPSAFNRSETQKELKKKVCAYCIHAQNTFTHFLRLSQNISSINSLWFPLWWRKDPPSSVHFSFFWNSSKFLTHHWFFYLPYCFCPPPRLGEGRGPSI